MAKRQKYYDRERDKERRLGGMGKTKDIIILMGMR